MSEQRHTPLPWSWEFHRSEHSEGSIESSDRECLAIITGSSYGVTFGGPNRDWSGDFDDDDEHEANAEFIVRACNSHYDLVGFIELQSKYINDMLSVINGNKTSESQKRINDISKALIAKAKGETA